MRKHWIDNLRWSTVLLVLLYHVVYFYNNKGVFGGIGGFGDFPDVQQYQDVLMYMVYPWFMPIMFLLAGISARYSLQNRSRKEWFRSRTRKLLVPGTIGLFVFHWMVGYFNAITAQAVLMDGIPLPIRYGIYAVSGTGPLWFIQDLWLFSLILLLVCRLDGKDKFWNWCSKANTAVIVLLGLLFWVAEQTLIKNPRPESADGLLNLYKPLFYLTVFLMGYFVFSHDEVQQKVRRMWVPMMACAAISGVILIITTWGQNNTSPEYLCSPLNCLYGWLMCLAMMGWFAARFDCTNTFSQYMTRSSYGLYIVHYLVIAALGYQMKVHTTLPPVAMYLILTAAVFSLSPLIYELLRRIPFIRWSVLGEK